MADIEQRFIRWQTTSMSYLTTVNSLLLAISFASIGFVLTQLNNKNIDLVFPSNRWLLVGIVLHVFSAICGVTLNLFRLLDFRFTFRVVKLKKKSSSINSKKIKIYQCLATCLGKTTWIIFFFQCAFLVFGFSSISIALGMIYYNRF